MSNELFGNKSILNWLSYYVENTQINLERVKILDITKKNKNLIPAIESNDAVLVFTDVGHPDIFYKMWDRGFGECEVWYNIGSEPVGPIKNNKIKDMINRGIDASAAMLILNPNAKNTYKIGMKSSNFSRGSVQYVGSEIRAIILNKMHVSYGDDICLIDSESITIEAAIIAGEGHVIAVEKSARDRQTLEDNLDKFGINNVTIVDKVNEETFAELPVPSLTMMVATPDMEDQIEYLLKINPNMEFVIYTLDFLVAGNMPKLFEKYNIKDMEIVRVSISKLDNTVLKAEPAPWLITGRAGDVAEK